MLNNKTILITGGTGSFGKEFIKIVLQKYKPARLIVFSRDELKQFEMRSKFPETDDSPIRYFLGDVRDKNRLYRAFDNVDIVVHAAALKQVPALEYNPMEAIKTNIIGAANVIDAAIDRNVGKVVALSTDKACNPINLYGATKLCFEKLFTNARSYSGHHKTQFCVSRYGNVIGSRGSVIPSFLRQKEKGTLTITHKDMTRFIITLDQSAKFVLKCIERVDRGEIFIPKMPSVNIMDLAKAIAPECKYEIMGIRPGEKLHESLISRDDAYRTIELDDMFVIQPHFLLHTDDLKKQKKGRRVIENFEYRSDTNPVFFKAEEIKKLINYNE